MLKIITKRGIVEKIIKTGGLPTYIKTDAFENPPIWYFKCEDIEKDDAIILVGYMSTDEYSDPVLYVCAYFNITKHKLSDTKNQVNYLFWGSIATLIILVLYWIYVEKTALILLLSIVPMIITFFGWHSLFAYRFIEKEIEKLNQ